MGDVEVITGIGPIRRTRFDDAKQEWYAEAPLNALCRLAQVNARLLATCKRLLVLAGDHKYIGNKAGRDTPLLDEAIERAKAAIVKAEGDGA